MSKPFAGRTIKPMKAAGGELPSGQDWAYEIKWDGMRVIAFLQHDEVRLQTTNLLDATHRFPELERLSDAVHGMDAILDGEVVATDADGRPSFSRLQERIHVSDRSAARTRAAENPVSLVIFDILHLDGHDTHDLPYDARRALLEQAVENGPGWRLASVHYDHEAELLEAVTDQRLEGLVAKRRDSVYRPGRRTTQWRKVKPRRRQEFVVGGWVSGEGHRSEVLGSLIVGFFDDEGQLRFAGRVGSGIDSAELRRLRDRLDRLARRDSPFAGSVGPKAGRTFHWVEPELVVEVAFAEWIEDHHLRHPTYAGQRLDVDPRTVRQEP